MGSSHLNAVVSMYILSSQYSQIFPCVFWSKQQKEVLNCWQNHDSPILMSNMGSSLSQEVPAEHHQGASEYSNFLNSDRREKLSTQNFQTRKTISLDIYRSNSQVEK